MAVREKRKACSQCGNLSVADKCPACGSNQFLDKYKGEVAVFNATESEIAQKLTIKNNGNFALRYG
jgi:RNA polymerase subunit RPABC4/transcription elongation factor Spt4